MSLHFKTVSQWLKFCLPILSYKRALKYDIAKLWVLGKYWSMTV